MAIKIYMEKAIIDCSGLYWNAYMTLVLVKLWLVGSWDAFLLLLLVWLWMAEQVIVSR